MNKRFMFLTAIVVCTVVLGCAGSAMAKRHRHGHDNRHHRGYFAAKNIIFMVPDGMGLADVTAARIFQNGPDGPRLTYETLPVIGYQSTHSANSSISMGKW